MPGESLTKTFQRNEFDDSELAEMSADRHEHGPWSHEGLLLADIWDLLAAFMHGFGGSKDDPPRYPRPGVAPPGEGGRRGRMNLAQMRLYLDKRQIGGPASDDSP